MSQLPAPDNAAQAPRKFNLGIRGKVTLPYLILTFAVAFVGVFIVTQFVTDSIEERFTNQLADAAKVAADGFVRVERTHLDLWRILAATQGLPEAARAGNAFQLRDLIEGPAASRAIDSVWIVDATHVVLLRLDRTASGEYTETLNRTISSWEPLDRVLRGERDQFGDKFSGLLREANQPYHLFTVGPIRSDDTLVGAIMVGTRLDTALRAIGNDAVARVSAYDLTGGQLDSTLPPAEPGDPENRLAPAQVNELLQRATSADGQSEFLSLPLKRGSSEYRLAYRPLLIRQNAVGVYSIGLESNFIINSSVTSRLLFAVIFGTMVVAVFAIGLTISRRLVTPILRLVSTSQAVAAGNLSQRTGLSGGDEIGKLASTFDNMTQKLQERTRDLELLLQAHREEALKTRAILSSIADGVLVLDSRGRIIMMNSAAEHMLGDLASDFSVGMLREHPLERLEPPLEPQSALNGSEVRKFEINRRTISAHAAPVITNDGQQLGTVVALRDITREAEIDRLKDSFIEQVSHELRTPLTAVKGYSDLMLQTAADELPEKYLDFLNIINRHADSLVAMITELLDITQLEAGSLRLRLERIDLNELVDVALDVWRERLDEKQLSLELTRDPNSTSVIGDRRRLHWAIEQLISNAYHYTESGGQVKVGVAGTADFATITVADTGIGITPEDRKYLFTRFFRSASRVHSNERGVGLGLYIVKTVTEAHRGKVEVDSLVGRGSTFRLILPLNEVAGEPPIVQMAQDNR
ncbi:MAG TPA: ATP-binding protein [Anaerolineae bacterium]|nr:ATP-binding protein [Anaerolineae bacterium]